MVMAKVKKYVLTLSVTAQMIIVNASANGGGKLASSNIGVGIKNMINDASGFMLVLCPIVAGCVAVYFLVRRGIADEQDGKMWQRRAIIAVVCGVAGMLVSGAIGLISSYFSV